MDFNFSRRSCYLIYGFRLFQSHWQNINIPAEILVSLIDKVCLDLLQCLVLRIRFQSLRLLKCHCMLDAGISYMALSIIFSRQFEHSRTPDILRVSLGCSILDILIFPKPEADLAMSLKDPEKNMCHLV
jgi:hypothetical protein